jgi:UDP-3-O-[3-hydroxymyristoyl] N-acetylglucosamine deacetylase
MPNGRCTIERPATFEGVGLHTGLPAKVRVLPAGAGAGISFRRADVPGSSPCRASWERVGSLDLCTTLSTPGGEVSTVEHLMSALAASGVDDAEVEVHGPEVPILDGSSLPFLDGISAAGVLSTVHPRPRLRVVRPVQVGDAERFARIEPYDGFAVSCGIAYGNPAIGRSSFSGEVTADAYRREIAPARTFALESDVEGMRARGLALGGSLANAVVVGDAGVINPGGLRFPDEFARHKALDAIGDLYLVGAPMLGRFVSRKGGHALNVALVAALASDRSAWRWDCRASGGHGRLAA